MLAVIGTVLRTSDDVLAGAEELEALEERVGRAEGDGAVYDERVVNVDEERHALCTYESSKTVRLVLSRILSSKVTSRVARN